MRAIAILTLLILVFSVQASHAASPKEPAFRKLEPYRIGLSGFGLNFAMDEEQCKKHYGRMWQSKCAAFAGRYGETAKGIKLSPAAEGHWQWTGDSSLQFMPKDQKTLKPGASYTINLANLSLPANIRLDKHETAIRSWPLAALPRSIKFLTDPSPSARHRLSLALQFNYPVPENFALPELSAGNARFGKPEAVWNADRTFLNISWPVSSLPDEKTLVRINCGKLAQISEKEGRYQLNLAPEKGQNFFTASLPARNRLFKVDKIALVPVLNDDLDQEYDLEIQTSLYASADELLKNLLLFELPEKNSAEAGTAYNWQLAPSLSTEVLEKSGKLKARLLSANSTQSRFKLRIAPKPGRYVLAVIDGRFQSSSGLALGQPRLQILQAMDTGASLGFLQPGNILPLAKNGKIELHAANLDRIHYEFQRISDPYLALMANGQNIFEGNYEPVNDFESISEKSSGDIRLAEPKPGRAQFAALDIARLLKDLEQDSANISGLFRLNLTGFRNGEARAWANRLILASDLGLMVKKTADGDFECFAQDLQNGLPVENADIKILSVNGKTLASAPTDGQGHVCLKSLSGLKRESRPVVAIALKDGQLAWLPLEDRSRKVDFSSFSTEGQTKNVNGLNAFIFSQRGIYRPGEEFLFGIILKKENFAPLDENLPLWAEIIDPRGRLIHGQSLETQSPGLAEKRWQAPNDALTGKYVFNVRTGKNGALLATETVKIEEFQPDNLKMRIRAPEYKGWLKPGEEMPEIAFELQNLYGTPAASHRINSRLLTTPAKFAFDGYEDFIFTDPAPLLAEGLQRKLPQLLSNEEGQASISLPPDFCKTSSANIKILAEGLAADSGRAVSASRDLLVSPADFVIGYRPRGPVTNLGFIMANSSAPVELIALDSNLKNASLENLLFEIHKREMTTSLVSDSTGAFKYDETPLNNPVKSWTGSLPKNGLRLELPTSKPGDYLLTIKDQGKTVCEIPFTVTGNALRAPGESPDLAKLRLKTDKKIYRAGENARISLALPYDGTGLISLEQDGIEAFTRFSGKVGETVQELPIPASFEGNGYIVVSYVRSGDSPAVYMNPHISAAAPISVNMDRRKLDLRLNAPDSQQPGSTVKIGISSPEEGKAILYAVDEGIHLLTGYQAPRPLYELLGNRALNVSTIQGFDLLMPSLQERIPAFGGGTDNNPFGLKFQNPFKRKNEPPVTVWSGIIDIGPVEKFVEINIPDYYNGNLRIYAVGVSDSRAGCASAQTAIKAPLVISPNLPLFISPQDQFEGSLVIENTSARELAVKLAASCDDYLELIQNLPDSAKIPANSQIILPFRAKARNMPGAAALKFRVSGNGKLYERKSDISVRPASYLKTTFTNGVTSEDIIVDNPRTVFENQAQNRSLISPLPLPLVAGLGQYLEYFPHGCTEQLTSRAFGMLSARKWLNQPETLQKQLETALSAIQTRANGAGVALWSGSEPDLLLTIYAADFLLGMRKAGYGGVTDLLEQLLGAIEENCMLNSASLTDSKIIAYGIWVLTREGRITTQLIENLLQSLADRQVQGWEKDLTAAFIAASQKEMHIARTLPVADVNYKNENWLDEYAQMSLHAYILARYFPEQFGPQQQQAFINASRDVLDRGGFATFSASQGIRTLMEAFTNAPATSVKASVACLDDVEGKKELLADGQGIALQTPQCSRLKISLNGQTKPLYWQMAVTGYDKSPQTQPEAAGLEVSRVFLDEDGKPAESITQGDVITVQLQLRSEKGLIKDCVIADLLPGGTELVLSDETWNRKDSKIGNIDRKDDRVLIYADLDNEPLSFQYKIRAVNRGEFLAPPARAEAMYDQACSGQSSGQVLGIR